MRYIVYGAGAIGGTIGGRLFQHGHDVTLIARGAHGERCSGRRGLTLADPDDDGHPPDPDGRATRRSCASAGRRRGAGHEDPGHRTLALTDLAAVAPSDGAGSCAQNGVENERLALRRTSPVYGVCVMLPGEHVEPGVVERVRRRR